MWPHRPDGPISRWGARGNRPLRVLCLVAQQGLCGIVAGRAHDAAAGVGAGATEVQTLDGRAIASAFGGGPQREKLVGRDLAVKDVAVGHAVTLLNVDGAENLSVQHG